MGTPDPYRWHTLSPYLDRVLDVPEEERTAWLEALAAKSPEIAADVRGMLDEHRALSDEGFLEWHPDVPPGPPAQPRQAVGAYTLVSPIGEGGMGTVWLAERSDGRFERRAAVKFLSIALVGRGEERFLREGQILGRLSHPHIAHLLDAGVTLHGQPYLILEHIDGEHIDRHCDRLTLDVQARVRLMLDVLAAVAHAHAHLVVHSDIKPSNVVVAADGTVKLLDFGIAGLLEDDLRDVAKGSSAAFTPEYASPEQIAGEPVTTAADVYSLGVLLYVLLTGRHPAGDCVGSPARLVDFIVNVAPAPPSQAVLGTSTPPSEAALAYAARRGTTPSRLHRALCGDLDAIVCKALKKRPEERYPSVAALADDLRRYLAHFPVAARRNSVATTTVKFVRRNRFAVALSMLAMVATVAGAAGTLIQADNASVQRDFAFHELSRAEALNDLDAFLLSDAAPSGKPFTVDDLLRRAEHVVERQHGGNEATRVELLMAIGRQYAAQDEDTNARRVLSEAYARSRTLSDAGTRASASCSFGSILAPAGQIARAEALVQEGLQQLPSQPQFAVDRFNCLLRGSYVAREAGQSTEAIARVRAAQRVLQASPLHSAILELRALMDLADSYRIAGLPVEASQSFARAAGLLGVLGRDDTETAGTLFNNWALVLQQLGRPLDAERVFRRAIEISRAGQDQQGVSPMLLVNYARALRDLDRVPEAAAYAERGYQAALKAGDQVVMNQVLLLRASIFRMQGNLAGAAADLADVEPRLRRALPSGHIAFAALMLQQGLNAGAGGDIGHALALTNQATAVAEAAVKAGRQGRDSLPVLLRYRSDFERQLGELTAAVTDAKRSVALLQHEVQPGTWSNLLGEAYLALARALGAEGSARDATTALRAAIEHLEKTVGPEHSDTRSARQLLDSMARHVE